MQQMGLSSAQISTWYEVLRDACTKYAIDNPYRLAAFFANAMHETGGFKIFEENLNYSAAGLMKTFKKYFNSSNADAYARNPQKIASKVYASRMGNGDEASGEGWKYRGRGVFQLTGKAMYKDYSQAGGIDFVGSPDKLLEPYNSAYSGAWYFSKKGCAPYADRDDITKVRYRVNGGTNGLSEVTSLYEKYKPIFKADPKTIPTVPPTKEDTPATPAPSFNESSGAANSNGVYPSRPLTGGSPSYPWNWVWESRAGHVMEVDDTPEAPRLSVTHTSGSYLEMNENGAIVTKTINDYYSFVSDNEYHSIGGNFTSVISGVGYYHYGGTATFDAGGMVFIQSPAKVQMNTPTVSCSDMLESPHGTFDDIIINDIIYGWIQNAKYADTAASLGGTPLDFEGNAIGGANAPAIQLSESYDAVDMNVPTTFHQPIKMSSSSMSPSSDLSIAVVADAGSPTGVSLAYSKSGIWYRSGSNTAVT